MLSPIAEFPKSKGGRGPGTRDQGDLNFPGPRPQAPGPSNAFTLLEMLFAVTMFSVLLVAVSSLVMLGTRAQLSWGESLQPYKEIQRALNSLERDLESAQPLFGIPVLLGPEGSSLEFARIGVGASEAEGWVRVVYRFEPAEESVSLIREVFPWEQGPSPAPQREEHLATLGDGKFSVGKVNEQTQELIWDTSWDGEMYGVPKLVKVDCTFPSGANPGGISLSRVIRNPSGVFAIMETP